MGHEFAVPFFMVIGITPPFSGRERRERSDCKGHVRAMVETTTILPA